MNQKRNVTPGHDEGARLTPQEAAAMMKPWVYSYFDDDASIGDLLLLLRSICYTPELAGRENILTEVERLLVATAPCADGAINAVMRERLTVARSRVKEGGTQ